MTSLKSRTKKLKIINLSSIVLILILFSTTEVLGQRDSLSLAQHIKATNYLLISPFAQGVFLSPFELRQHHRDNTIKNIEWVNSFEIYKATSSKKDTIPFIVKNNQTIIQKPDERFNSRTYAYHKDGRIHKVFRGKHLDDLFVNADNGYLIQHGYGGELKRAKRKGRDFEWYNVKRNRLEYITSYDDDNRISKIKTMGHLFGPGMEYELEEYSWEENLLMSKSTIRKFKAGSIDSVFLKFTYDSLGLISSISTRKDGETTWTTTPYDTKIEYLDNKHLNITVANKDQLLLSITFDHFDNAVEIINPYSHRQIAITYRKIKRWNWF